MGDFGRKVEAFCAGDAAEESVGFEGTEEELDVLERCTECM
jgi:hypothetical protein